MPLMLPVVNMCIFGSDDFIDASWCEEEMYVLASKYHADILIFNFTI